MTFFTIFFLIALFLVIKTFIIVEEREAVVKERLGKFKGILKPGFHFMIPFLDRAAYRHEMREQVIDVPPQVCITKDNIQVKVDGLVYIQVNDPEKASYGIENYRRASVNLAQTTMRSEIGKLSLDDTFSERDLLNDNIVKEIDRASDAWGIKVLRYEIKDITPSAQVLHTLEKQMEAEREKRAEILLADADKVSRINLSEGERAEEINISEGRRQQLINEADGRAKQIELVAEATAEGIRIISDAIEKPGGSTAIKMQIIEQFTDEFGKILEKTDVSVVPTKLATLQGFFEGLNEVSQNIHSTTGSEG